MLVMGRRRVDGNLARAESVSEASSTMSPAPSETMMLIGYLFLTLSVFGCGQPPFPGVGRVPQSHGGPVRDHVSFVDTLRAAGYSVSPSGDVQQPFLRARGTLLRISGGDLSARAEAQSFNYDDRDLVADGLAAAQADADQIQPDGQPKTARVTWSVPPHFFHQDRLIVLYVGSDPRLLHELETLLGP